MVGGGGAPGYNLHGKDGEGRVCDEGSVLGHLGYVEGYVWGMCGGRSQGDFRADGDSFWRKLAGS